MESEGYFVRMRGTPGDDSLELYEIVGDRTDFHEVGFNGLRLAHGSFSMSQGALGGEGFRNATGS